MQCNWQVMHWVGDDPIPFKEKEGVKGRYNWIGWHELSPSQVIEDGGNKELFIGYHTLRLWHEYSSEHFVYNMGCDEYVVTFKKHRERESYILNMELLYSQGSHINIVA